MCAAIYHVPAHYAGVLGGAALPVLCNLAPSDSQRPLLQSDA